MITSIEEYNQRLKDIENNSDFNIKKIINPSSEEIFEIDLNTRIITVPEMFRNGTVEYDHNAETLYFKIDRYFDDEDLYTKTFVMQFKNSKNQGQISAALSKYLDGEKEDKIIIIWTLSNNVTNVAGLLQFALKIYNIEETEENNYQYTYNLNTRIASIEINEGFNFSVIADYEEEIGNWDNFISEIYSKFENLENKLTNKIENKNNSINSYETASGYMTLYQLDNSSEIIYSKTIPISYNKNNLIIGSLYYPVIIQNYNNSFSIDLKSGNIITKGSIFFTVEGEEILEVSALNNSGYIKANNLEINTNTLKITGDVTFSENTSLKIGSNKLATEAYVDNLIEGIEEVLQNIIQGA